MDASDIDLDTLQQNLLAGQPVIGSIGQYGNIHIERPQPFLCLYRYQKEPTYCRTSDLVTTQASWLIEPSESQERRKTRRLIASILRLLSVSFSNVLLLDIQISRVPSRRGEIEEIPAKITLHSSPGKTPTATLKELDMALVSAEWSLPVAPRIEISYDTENSSKLLEEILIEKNTNTDNQAHQRTNPAACISIEISPYFIDRETNDILPQVFAELRSNLALAIKRAVFCFIDASINYSPQHFHELGPKTLKAIDIDVDRKLSEIDQQIDLLLHVTPVNSFDAWRQFSHDRYEKAPEFHYRSLRTAPWQLKRQLFSIPVEMVDDPALHQMFSKKQQEMDQQISMLVDRDTERFVLQSQQVYGSPDESLVDTANTILARIHPPQPVNHTPDQLDAESFAHFARSEIANYQKKDTTLTSMVEIRDDIPGIMVSHGNFLIGSDAAVSRSRVEPTLQHEIGTHVLTWHNGGCQPLHLLQSGLAGYEALQEGIAVLAEFLVGGLDEDRIRQLSGRVIAIDQMVKGADFVTVFKTLTETHRFHERHAYNIVMRVFRGGGFTKDAIYLKGFLDVIDYVACGETLETLLVGKISFSDIEITRELLWRKILSPAKVLPNYLNTTQAMQRIRHIRENTNRVEVILEDI